MHGVPTSYHAPFTRPTTTGHRAQPARTHDRNQRRAVSAVESMRYFLIAAQPSISMSAVCIIK